MNTILEHKLAVAVAVVLLKRTKGPVVLTQDDLDAVEGWRALVAVDIEKGTVTATLHSPAHAN